MDMPLAGVDVVLTEHFLERLYKRQCNFPITKFFKYVPQLISTAGKYHPDDCMVIIGGAKLIFYYRRSKNGDKLFLKTVMPENYKHNIFTALNTHNLGKIDE